MSKDIVKYFDNIESSFKKSWILNIVVLVFAALVVGMTVYRSYAFQEKIARQVYVIDQGQPLVAFREDASESVEQRAFQHVRMFHMLFFNLAPVKETLEYNIEQALVLADRSAYNYWSRLSEQGYYSRLVEDNISQHFSMDSIRVDTSVYPYESACFGKVYSVRGSSVTRYDFVSTCILVDRPFTPEQPTGFQIEKFRVVKYEDMGTVNR